MRLGFGPQDWDLGLKAGIWAVRLRYGPGGRGGTEEEEKKGKVPLCESIDPFWAAGQKEKKIPHVYESISIRPLWDRCPKEEEE